MKAAWVLGATALALALQTTLTRFLVRGDVAVDLVLVVVVYFALTSGPVTGLLTGAFAGLMQDAVSSGAGVGIIGIGGLAKTTVGFLTGILSTQFIVTQSISRFVVFLGATVLHAALFIGLYAVLGLRDAGSPYIAVLGQAFGNAVVGVVAFQLAELLPGAVERRRLGRAKTRL